MNVNDVKKAIELYRWKIFPLPIIVHSGGERLVRKLIESGHFLRISPTDLLFVPDKDDPDKLARTKRLRDEAEKARELILAAEMDGEVSGYVSAFKSDKYFTETQEVEYFTTRDKGRRATKDDKTGYQRYQAVIWVDASQRQYYFAAIEKVEELSPELFEGLVAA